MSLVVNNKSVAINFGQHFVYSAKFDSIFEKGMSLVDKTAQYLDGKGRKQAKSLKSPLSVIYITESMRLTSRLLSLSSWLLSLRKLRTDGVSIRNAIQIRDDLKLKRFGHVSHIKHFDKLPQEFQELIIDSYKLSQQVNCIDRALRTNSYCE
ncbi:MAG: DUF1465 family protein [Hyphomicrobiaceae bacterium]|nr:DUF1465 family protein [Hyphomicrobiaceae bacterium]